MEIAPLAAQGRQIIQSYGGGGFRIGGVRHTGSVLVFPGRTAPWAPHAATDLNIAALAEVADAAGEIDLLLLGTGMAMVPPPHEVRAALKALGIAVDAMGTSA